MSTEQIIADIRAEAERRVVDLETNIAAGKPFDVTVNHAPLDSDTYAFDPELCEWMHVASVRPSSSGGVAMWSR